MVGGSLPRDGTNGTLEGPTDLHRDSHGTGKPGLTPEGVASILWEPLAFNYGRASRTKNPIYPNNTAFSTCGVNRIIGIKFLYLWTVLGV